MMTASASSVFSSATAHDSRPDALAEAALVAKLQSGDQSAYATVMLKYGGRMRAVAQRLLGNEHDANDAVQDAFLSAFRSLDQFAGHAQLGTWLHKIVVNAALMKLRARRRRDECSIVELLPAFDETGHRLICRRPGGPGGGTMRWNNEGIGVKGPEEALERSELRMTIRKKIDQLPHDYRTVLLLRDIEEMDTDQTAECLGIKPGAVKTRLHRARMALRELLEREFTA
jgi:RNA polymerase sigma-70 factor (ECF subfamily)